MIEDKHKLGESAADGMQAAARRSTVGISMQSNAGAALLGSGVLIRTHVRHFILTAEHVIAGVSPEQLHFILPSEGELKTIELPQALSLKAVKTKYLRPHRRLDIKAICVDTHADLAAIEVDESLDGRHPTAVFYEFPAETPIPTAKDELLIVGFPHDLTRVTVADDRVALLHFEWTTLVQMPSGLVWSEYDPSTDYLAPFVSGQNFNSAHPRGLSGSAAWWHLPSPEVWHPNLALAGITLATQHKHKLLRLISGSAVRAFFNDKVANG